MEREAVLMAEQDGLHEDLLRIRRELAELKFDLALRRIFRKYSPDQPRVPKGNPDGGEWTRDAARDSSLFAKPAALRRQEQSTEFSSARRGGHHYVARGAYKHRNLSKETRKVFEDATSGTLSDRSTNVFSSAHRKYNKAVNELFDDYLARNKLSEEQMTPDHARQLLKEVITSRDPRIYRFNTRIWMRQLFRGGGRFRGNE